MYIKYSESIRYIIELVLITIKSQNDELRTLDNWSDIWEKIYIYNNGKDTLENMR